MQSIPPLALSLPFLIRITLSAMDSWTPIRARRLVCFLFCHMLHYVLIPYHYFVFIVHHLRVPGIQAMVEVAGPGFINFAVRCALPERGALEECLVRGDWRVDRAVSCSNYKRMTNAINLLTGPGFSGPAADSLRTLICRLLPHSLKPPKAFWDKGVEEESDPRYNAEHYGWSESDRWGDKRAIESPRKNDHYISSRINQLRLASSQASRLSSILSSLPLNESQRRAVKAVSEQRLTLIQVYQNYFSHLH